MPKPATILVVCTGNVCRSPYLHRRLELALGPDGVQVHSAGTGALAGHPMDETMAALLGPDADPTFRARQLTAADALDADLVLTATRTHRSLVSRLAPRAMRRTFAVADFSQLAAASLQLRDGQPRAGASLAERVAEISSLRARVSPLPPEQADVPDPFRGTPEEYAASAAMIDALVPPIVAALRP